MTPEGWGRIVKTPLFFTNSQTIVKFEQTYLIHLLRPLAGSSDAQIRSIPKLYFLDTGLLNRVAQVSEGALFENKLCNQLQLSLLLHYYRTAQKREFEYYQRRTGAEIDFVVGKAEAYEAKVLATPADYAKLQRVAEKLELDTYQLVTKDQPIGFSEQGQYVFPYER